MFLRAKTVATLGSLLEVPCLRGTPDLLNQHFYQSSSNNFKAQTKIENLGIKWWPDLDKGILKPKKDSRKDTVRDEWNMWK